MVDLWVQAQVLVLLRGEAAGQVDEALALRLVTVLDVEALCARLVRILFERWLVEAPADLTQVFRVGLVCRLKARIVPHGALTTRRVNQARLTVDVLVHQALNAIVVHSRSLKAQLGAVLRTLLCLLLEARERSDCLFAVAIVDCRRRVLNDPRSQNGWRLTMVIESLEALAAWRNVSHFLLCNFHEFEIDLSPFI